MDATNCSKLTEQEFYKFIDKDYAPSKYESHDGDSRFPKGVHYAYLCRRRCYYVCKVVSDYLLENTHQKAKLLDMGFFPGTLIRILDHYFKDNLNCMGAGLKCDPAFEEAMNPFVERCFYQEFDPFYAHDRKIDQLDVESGSMDMIVATEILEHLISPLELIVEAARLLKKGGLFIVTTPNVSHTGAVIKLLIGRSNYERLKFSPMNMQVDEWRGHIRFYDKRELITLCDERGLHLKQHKYFTETGWDFEIRSKFQNVAYFCKKLSWIFPVYRESHFAVFQKK